jgi:exoribonuclease R
VLGNRVGQEFDAIVLRSEGNSSEVFLPDPENGAVKWLRRSARSLGITWPKNMDAAELLAGLDPERPEAMALFMDATRLLRGAGYTVFDGNRPELATHAGIAAPYAHVTAPLRRLADRYAGEACVALCAGEPVPAWVLEALPGLPATMRDSDRRAGHYQRAIIDLVEALVLAPRVGERFEGSITAVAPGDARSGMVMLRELAIEAPVRGEAPLALGAEVPVTLVAADPARRVIGFSTT